MLLPRLQRLQLGHVSAPLDLLADLPSLKELELHPLACGSHALDTRITLPALEGLTVFLSHERHLPGALDVMAACPNLTHLDLTNNADYIGPEHQPRVFHALTGLSRIQRLSMSLNTFELAIQEAAQRGRDDLLPALRSLRLKCNRRRLEIEQVLGWASGLTELQLWQADGICAAFVDALPGCLRSLELHECRVDQEVRGLGNRCVRSQPRSLLPAHPEGVEKE